MPFNSKHLNDWLTDHEPPAKAAGKHVLTAHISRNLAVSVLAAAQALGMEPQLFISYALQSLVDDVEHAFKSDFTFRSKPEGANDDQV